MVGSALLMYRNNDATEGFLLAEHADHGSCNAAGLRVKSSVLCDVFAGWPYAGGLVGATDE